MLGVVLIDDRPECVERLDRVVLADVDEVGRAVFERSGGVEAVPPEHDYLEAGNRLSGAVDDGQHVLAACTDQTVDFVFGEGVENVVRRGQAAEVERPALLVPPLCDCRGVGTVVQHQGGLLHQCLSRFPRVGLTGAMSLLVCSTPS